MFKKYGIILCLAGLSLAFPLERTPEDDGSSVAFVPEKDERQAAIIGALGSVLAPVVGQVIGPLFTNLANGFVGALTGNRPGSTGSSTGSRPTFDAYMIQVPGAEGPYMLLTQDSAFDGLNEPLRTPNSPFNISPLGKVRVKPNPILAQNEDEKIITSKRTSPSIVEQ